MRGSETDEFLYDGSLVTADGRHGSLETTLSWTYNNDFQPTFFSYAAATVAYGYDADRLLTRSGEYTISRDASNGLPIAVTASGYRLDRGFSGYGELDDTTVTVAGTDAYGYSLIRDDAGRIAHRTERVGVESRTLSYAYDLLGRLTTVTAGGDVVEAYHYDANGNRTYAYVPARGIDATMTFDAADRIAASAEATYTTDADGFVTSKETSVGTTTYRYSTLGELTTVTVPSGHTITYAYDAFSRRVSRSVDGTLTDRYLWADATHLLAVYPSTGTTPTYRFTFADGRVPVSVEMSAGTFRLLTDQVGTVRALVASDGTISSRVERDSYGAVTSGTVGFPLGFAGGLGDADTGLVHFGAREYDPALGRWLSRDPIDFAGGDANLYGYVLGDPVRAVDPEGLHYMGYSSEYGPFSVYPFMHNMGELGSDIYRDLRHRIEQSDNSETTKFQVAPIIACGGTSSWDAEMRTNTKYWFVGVTNPSSPFISHYWSRGQSAPGTYLRPGLGPTSWSIPLDGRNAWPPKQAAGSGKPGWGGGIYYVWPVKAD